MKAISIILLTLASATVFAQHSPINFNEIVQKAMTPSNIQGPTNFDEMRKKSQDHARSCFQLGMNIERYKKAFAEIEQKKTDTTALRSQLDELIKGCTQ